ncbi:MAG TPA: branched-chain amino acid ABC transporter permease [Acidimicrobiales bacterium]
MPIVLAFFNENFFQLTVFLNYVTNGLSNGALYALMAITVVIIYRTTAHLNFAQGEMATFSTFLVFVLTAEKGWWVWLAIPAIVLASMAGGAALERWMIRPVQKKSALAPVIVSLGLFFVFNALCAVIWGTEQRSPVPAPFPNGLTDSVTILDGPPKFYITYVAMGIWVTVAVLVVGLTLMLQKTKLGLAYRAVASTRESSQLVGIPVGRMLMFGWALAAGIGAIAGVMAAEYLGRLDFNLMAGVLLYGFAAATLGGFDSLKGAVVGGVIVGEAEALLPAMFSFIGTELSLVMALIVILVVLMVRPQGLFGSKRVERV